MTVEDFEDLAYEASPQVARVLCLGARVATPDDAIEAGAGQSSEDPVTFGHVKVVIVEESSATAQPGSGSIDAFQQALSPGLERRVREYLQARAVPYVTVDVSGPAWVPIEVSATVRSSAEPRRVKREIERALRAFLHPLHGGAEKRGFSFGRRPHKSDLYRLLLGLAGVEEVTELTLPSVPPELRATDLICPGQLDNIKVEPQSGGGN